MKISIIAVIVFLFTSLNVINAQPDIGQPGGPFIDPSANGNGTGTQTVDPLSPSLNPPTDPGGPIDPPTDLAPFDGGIAILLIAGLAIGYQIVQARRKQQQPALIN